jgi:hypothetical protein
MVASSEKDPIQLDNKKAVDSTRFRQIQKDNWTLTIKEDMLNALVQSMRRSMDKLKRAVLGD